MRFFLTLSLTGLFACTPEGALDTSDTSWMAGGVPAAQGTEVQVAGGTTAGTVKNCDPKKDPNCYDGRMITKSGGGSDIMPRDDQDVEPWPFGVPPRGTTATPEVFLQTNAGTELGTAALLVYAERDFILDAMGSGSAGRTSIAVGNMPAGSEVVYVHSMDVGKVPSLLIELDDRSTFLITPSASGTVDLRW